MSGWWKYAACWLVPAAACAALAPVPGAQVGRGIGSPATIDVQIFGSLRELMHEGRLGGRVPLAVALAKPHAYSLGALARLDGEFIIVDGEVWISRPGDRGTIRPMAYDSGRDSAALMVVAHVPSWRDIRITRGIPMARLEDTLAAHAQSAGLPRSGPFPFLILGPMTGLRWHVANGRVLAPGPSSHEAHAKAAVRGARDSVSATLVGFYSDGHRGVFTHHDSGVHMHVLVTAERLAAHVDSVWVSPGALLRLPILR